MTTKTNLDTAAAQYATRPKDEIFPTLQAWQDAATHDRDHSREVKYNLRDLRVVPHEDRVLLESPKSLAEFTHWSFGQLARTIHAPASYLRDLPPTLAAQAMTYGLKESARTEGQRAQILVKQNGSPRPIIRAATGDTYGRAWDAELGASLIRHFGDGCKASEGGTWQSPPTWSGEGAGQYRGDRNSFVLRIDGGSIVNDPRGWGGNGRLNRSIMISNSEVGDRSIWIQTGFHDFICGNHILWGYVIDGKSYRRRHVGPNAAQEAISELLRIARKYNERSASEDEKIIKTLTTSELAHTREGVIDELVKIGYTKQDAQDAYQTAEVKEPDLNPRSFWGIAAGTTRLSQVSGYQDDREELDQLAAQVLRKGAKVAA